MIDQILISQQVSFAYSVSGWLKQTLIRSVSRLQQKEAKFTFAY